MTRSFLRLCTAFGLMAAATSAHAGSISYGSYSVLNNQNVHITDSALGVSNEYSGSGQITLMNLSTGGSLLTWCVDIADTLLTSGSFTGTSLRIGGVWDGINALISNGTPLLANDDNASAALQVAIWQQEYGSAVTVTPDSSAVASEAKTFLANVANGTWKADTSKAVAVLNGGGANQDQAYLVSSSRAAVPVAEPASMMLLGAGVVAVAARRTRRAHTAA